jgi:hypothetical protein
MIFFPNQEACTKCNGTGKITRKGKEKNCPICNGKGWILIPMLLLAILAFAGCSKQQDINHIQKVFTITGKYQVQAKDSQWTWDFKVGKTYNQGELHTDIKGNKNNCGLYFFSNGTDTLICAAGNLTPMIYRGRIWKEDDLYRYEVNNDTLTFTKQ